MWDQNHTIPHISQECCCKAKVGTVSEPRSLAQHECWPQEDHLLADDIDIEDNAFAYTFFHLSVDFLVITLKVNGADLKWRLTRVPPSLPSVSRPTATSGLSRLCLPYGGLYDVKLRNLAIRERN